MPHVNPENDQRTVPDYCRHNETEVCGFFGEHSHLSNFFPGEVYYGGRKFPMREHAYQFAKLSVPHPHTPEYAKWDREYMEICLMTAAKVKKWGQPESFEQRELTLRPDWEKVKYDIMMAIVCDFYFRHRKFRKMLLETGSRYLEETNSWRDKCWGVCQGQGTNWLGKILMKVRELWKPLT